jgi:hypothetical protein
MCQRRNAACSFQTRLWRRRASAAAGVARGADHGVHVHVLAREHKRTRVKRERRACGFARTSKAKTCRAARAFPRTRQVTHSASRRGYVTKTVGAAATSDSSGGTHATPSSSAANASAAVGAGATHAVCAARTHSQHESKHRCTRLHAAGGRQAHSAARSAPDVQRPLSASAPPRSVAAAPRRRPPTPGRLPEWLLDSHSSSGS